MPIKIVDNKFQLVLSHPQLSYFQVRIDSKQHITCFTSVKNPRNIELNPIECEMKVINQYLQSIN